MKGSRLVRIAAVAVIVVASVLIMLTLRRADPSSTTRFIVIEMRASAGQSAKLFWSADGAFTEQQSARAPYSQSLDAVQRLRFLIPDRGVRWLRLDLSDAPGDVMVRGLRLLNRRGGAIELSPHQLHPADQFTTVTREGDAVRIETAPEANPSLLLSLACLEPSPIDHVTPAALLLMTIAVLGLLTVPLAAIGKEALALGSGASSRAATLTWLVGLMVVVLAAKTALMRANPVTAPFWDQWDGEAAALFIPFSNCRLPWDSMIAFHNEHRIFFSRVLALDLLLANGQWDPRLEQVVNAILHTVTGGMIALMFWLAAGRRRLDLMVVLVALAFALPYSWENTLIGFQSAFYFLLLFSVLGVWCSTHYQVGSAPWISGWLCTVCALFTAASGLLAPAVIAGISILQAVTDWPRLRNAAINFGLALLVFGGGYLLSAPPLPHHAVYRVTAAWEFFTALGNSLAWPRVHQPWLALVSWLPFVYLVSVVILRRLRTTQIERFTLGLGAWVVLHAAALAYGRGAGGALPAGRYMDFLSLGFLVNAIALASALDSLPRRTVRHTASVVALFGWMLFGAVGLNALVGEALVNLNVWRQYYAAQAQQVRRFVISGDRSALIGRPPLQEVPYPDPTRLVDLLQDPDIRRILPAAVREPIAVHAKPDSGSTFVKDGAYATAPRDPLAPSWGSFSAAGNAAQGRFESEPIPHCQSGGRLRFEVAGHLGADRHVLAVREVDGRRESFVRRPRNPQTPWWHATVPCPARPFQIVASDESQWSWFAYRPPVEIGSGSVVAEMLIDRSWGMLLGGLTLLAFAARWA